MDIDYSGRLFEKETTVKGCYTRVRFHRACDVGSLNVDYSEIVDLITGCYGNSGVRIHYFETALITSERWCCVEYPVFLKRPLLLSG